MKMIPHLSSIKQIEKQYNTGDLPVLVVCSDKEAYICKYIPSSNSAFKLACELVGAMMANAWNLSKTIVELKLNELINSEWTEAVWLNFLECLKDNLED